MSQRRHPEIDGASTYVPDGCAHASLPADSKPVCFRISGIPSTWTEATLQAALRSVDPDLDFREHVNSLSLFPDCIEPAEAQVALLSVVKTTPYLKSFGRNEDKYVPIPVGFDGNHHGEDLVIDQHFYELTPINLPVGHIQADIVAVTGLGGHAYGSWRNKKTHRMWLQDFLPLNFKNVRIMLYGYDSSLKDHQTVKFRLSNYRANFVQQLENSRRSCGTRPLIFVGHSLGGILIDQVLLVTASSHYHKLLRNSIRGIFFFATPHGGLQTEDLESMVDKEEADEDSASNLIRQLKEGSAFLEEQLDQLVDIWANFSGNIVSFYETAPTKTVTKVGNNFRTDGPEIQRVKRLFAQLHLPFERRYPVEHDHTEIVKFPHKRASTYQTLVTHLKIWLEKESNSTRSHDFETFLPEMISSGHDDLTNSFPGVDQQRHLATIPRLVENDGSFFWIFKNQDYINWGRDQKILAIVGPDDLHLEKAMAHIVASQETKSALRNVHTVLYFFHNSDLNTTLDDARTTKLCIHSLLVQVANRKLAPPQRTTFLFTFFGKLWSSIERENRRPQLSSTLCRDLLAGADSTTLWLAFFKALTTVRISHSDVVIVLHLKYQNSQEWESLFNTFDRFSNNLRRVFSSVRIVVTNPPISEFGDKLNVLEYDVERQECLKTLYFENTRYAQIQPAHETSFHWLRTHPDVMHWTNSRKSSLLLVEGKPGSGKSTLTRYFKSTVSESDELLKSSSDSTLLVGDFFYSHRDGDAQVNHRSMLLSLLHKFLASCESLFYHFQADYRRLKNQNDFYWPYATLHKILLSIRTHPENLLLIMVIDAFDESDPDHQREIIHLFDKLCIYQPSTGPHCTIKVFIASRPIPHLSSKRSVRKILLQKETTGDIIKYMRSFLYDTELDLPKDLRREAEQYVVEKADGVFLWVHLVRKDLQKYVTEGHSKKRILAFLRDLPKDLTGYYRRMLSEMATGRPENISDGKQMFQFCLFSYRPIELLELQHALTIPYKSGTNGRILRPDEAMPSVSSLKQSFDSRLSGNMVNRVTLCGGNFLEIKYTDKSESPIVQLMHQTAREFFIRSEDNLGATEFATSKQAAHRTIANVCIRYLSLVLAELNDPDHKWTPKSCAAYLESRPLLKYALKYVEQHLTESEDPNAESLFEVFKKDLYHHHSKVSVVLFERFLVVYAQGLGGNFKFRSPSRILMMKDATGYRNRMICEACRSGMTGAVAILLQIGNEAEYLSFAASEEDFEAFAVLLRYCETGQGARAALNNSALIRAANKNYDISPLLGLLRLDVDAKDDEGRTALMEAAANGNLRNIQLLLERSASIIVQDKHGRAALEAAAERGYEDVVRLILAEAHARHQTQLSRIYRALCLPNAFKKAAMNGHENVLRAMLEVAPDVLAQTHLYDHSLINAASGGHVDSVRLLIDRSAHFYIPSEGEIGQRALIEAATNGHILVVRLLLENQASRSTMDFGAWYASSVKLGTSRAFVIAASEGYTEMVQAFLDLMGDGFSGVTDLSGKTALMSAASNGHQDVISVLIRRKCKSTDSDADMIDFLAASDAEGKTALTMAAAYGNQGILRLLVDSLPHYAVVQCVVARDFSGRTALMEAAENGHAENVELLCSVLPEVARSWFIQVRDYQFRSALGMAVLNGHLGIASFLLEAKMGNPETPSMSQLPSHLTAIFRRAKSTIAFCHTTVDGHIARLRLPKTARIQLKVITNNMARQYPE